MFIYLFIVILLLAFMIVNEYLYEEGKNILSLSYGVCIITLCFFLSFRSYLVGADTKEYYVGFQQISNLKLGDVLNSPIYGYGGNYTLDFEYGYKILNKIISYFNKSPQLIIIFTGFLTILLLSILIKKYSPNPLLSLWLYVTLGIYQTQMNISRNSIAILISYFGIKYIYNKKLLKYLLVILIASMFHLSVLMLIPIYFFVNYFKLDFKNLKVYIILSIILGIFFGLGKEIVMKFVPTKYSYLTTGADIKLDGLLIGVVYIIIFLFIYLIGNNKQKMVSENKYGTWMFLFSILIYISGIGLSFAPRIAMLFGSYMIIYFPRLIYSEMDLNRRKLLVIFIVILCGAQYLLRIGINDIGQTLNYTFFWDV